MSVNVLGGFPHRYGYFLNYSFTHGYNFFYNIINIVYLFYRFLAFNFCYHWFIDDLFDFLDLKRTQGALR